MFQLVFHRIGGRERLTGSIMDETRDRSIHMAKLAPKHDATKISDLSGAQKQFSPEAGKVEGARREV